MRRVTAIVPVLDEAPRLVGLLQTLKDQVHQVIVADGGSTDGSAELAHRAGVAVARSGRGRGTQLRAAQDLVDGDVVWVVHADATPPSDAATQLADARAPWGAFRVRFDSADPRLAVTAAAMNQRAGRLGMMSGDMGMWCHVALLQELGGYAALPAFEDLDLSVRARAVAPWQLLDGPLVASARRWRERGTTRTILELWALRAAWHLGLPADRLGRRYLGEH